MTKTAVEKEAEFNELNPRKREEIFLPYNIQSGVLPQGITVSYDELVGRSKDKVLDTVAYALINGTMIPGGSYAFGSGSAIAPSIKWSSDLDTGWYLIAPSNPAATVDGVRRFDWNTTRIQYSSGYYQLLGPAAMSGFGSGYELISGQYTYDGALRYVLHNTNGGTSAHTTFTAVASGGFDMSMFTVGAGWVLGGASGNAVANEGGLILNNIWAGGAGAAGMLICNRTNSYMRFATNNTEWVRILATGKTAFNATTMNAAEQVRINGALTVNSLTSGRIPFMSANGLFVDETELQYNTTDNAVLLGGVVPSTLRVQFYVAAATETRTYTRSSASNAYVWTDRGGVGLDGTIVFTTSNDQNAEWTFGQRGSITGGSDITIHANNAGWVEYWRLAKTTGLMTNTVNGALLDPIHNLIQQGAGDSALRFALSTNHSYAIGADNTDDAFKVSYLNSGLATLGTNDYFTISTAGAVAFPTALTPDGLVAIGTGGTLTRFAPGTDGYVLVSDSTEAIGFAWEEMTGGTTVVDPTIGGYITIDRHPKNPLARTLWAPHPKRVKLVDLGPRNRLMVTGPQDIAPESSPTFYALTIHTPLPVDAEFHLSSGQDITADFRVDATDGYAYLMTSGGYFEMNGSHAFDMGMGVYNTLDDPSAGAFLAVTVASTSAGDPVIYWSNTNIAWALGMDTSEGEDLIFGKNGLGVGNDYFTITTDGRVIARHDGTTIASAGHLFELLCDVDGSGLVSTWNDSNGTSAVSGFYCKAGSTAIPSGVSLYHAAAGYTADPGILGDEAVLNGENNTIGIRYRVTNSGVGYHVFLTRNGGGTMNEIFRMTATPNIGIYAAAATNYQSMVGGIFIGNAVTIPAGNPAAGGYMYAEGGALKWRGPSGAITTMGAA